MIDKLIKLIKTILENTSTEVKLKPVEGTSWVIYLGDSIAIFINSHKDYELNLFSIKLSDEDEMITLEKLKKEIEQNPSFPLEKIIDELSEIALELI